MSCMCFLGYMIQHGMASIPTVPAPCSIILVRKMHCNKTIREHTQLDRWEECLLTRSTTRFIQASGVSRMLEGCDLYHYRNSKVADEDADDDTAFVRSGKAASGHTTRNVGVRNEDAKTCAQLLHGNPKRALSCCTPLISHHHPTSSEGISRTLPNLSA